MFQAFVTTIPQAVRPSLLSFETDSERIDFCLGPMCYWYVLADDDDLFEPGSAWRKGGAWDVEPEEDGYAPEIDYGERW
jgi:hypothetical protein